MKALAALITVVLLPGQVPPPADWVAAEKAIVRLPPSAFKDLPSSVRAHLERRQCTIPQPGDELEEPPPYNVIRGRFTTARSVDIAVLCSKDGVSTLLVFRGGATADVAELARSKDASWLQTGGPKGVVFSRAILPAKADAIALYHKEFGGPTPPPIDHEGIHDAFVGKAAVIRYWHRGRWLELAGID